jgi:iron complex outermembrane receptor protein
MARAPTFSGNAGISYTADLMGGNLDLDANVSYTDSYVIQNPSLYGAAAGPALANKQRYRQNAYALVNGSIRWTDPTDHFFIGVYGRNLTNKEFRLTYNGSAAGGDYSTPAKPREVGVKGGYKF